MLFTFKYAYLYRADVSCGSIIVLLDCICCVLPDLFNIDVFFLLEKENIEMLVFTFVSACLLTEI